MRAKISELHVSLQTHVTDSSLYCRSSFECVVKPLRMMLYEADFNMLGLVPQFFTLQHCCPAWFTSLRMFGDSCTWLDVGRHTFDLKYQWILISTIDSWKWLYRTVQMRTRVEHFSKREEVTCNLIHSVFFSCNSFDCEVWKNSQFAIKRISQSKPNLRYTI